MSKLTLLIIFGMIFVFGISFASSLSLYDGIYGYWSMNNTAGINATDSGQFYGNLTFNATPTWEAGKIGNAVNLKGKIYANISGLSQPDFSSSGFSLSLWAKNNSPWVTGSQILCQDGGFCWNVNANGLITGLGTTSSINISNGNYHHLVLTWNATNQVYKQYVDNNLNGTGILAPTVFGDSMRTQLGALTRNNQFFNQSMDEVGLWNRTLSPQEVSSLWNNGNGLGFESPLFTEGVTTFNSTTYEMLTETYQTNFTTTGTGASGHNLVDFT